MNPKPKKPKRGRRLPTVPEPPAMPECPPHLDDEARAEWARIVPGLLEKGLLHTTDRAAIAGYCQCWSRWAKAERGLAELGPVVKSPSGFPIQNPYLCIALKALDQMRRFLVEFGMTPKSRCRVDRPPGPGAPTTARPTRQDSA